MNMMTPRTFSFAARACRPLGATAFFSPLARMQPAVCARLFQSSPAALSAAAASTAAAASHKSKSHGSYHWIFERSLSVATLSLVGGAVALGPTPAIDFLLGFVIPAHCYMGLESIVNDYLPERRVRLLNTIGLWSVRIATAITIYGCYVINTADVGITAFTQRIWTGKL